MDLNLVFLPNVKHRCTTKRQNQRGKRGRKNKKKKKIGHHITSHSLFVFRLAQNGHRTSAQILCFSPPSRSRFVLRAQASGGTGALPPARVRAGRASITGKAPQASCGRTGGARQRRRSGRNPAERPSSMILCMSLATAAKVERGAVLPNGAGRAWPSRRGGAKLFKICSDDGSFSSHAFAVAGCGR